MQPESWEVLPIQHYSIQQIVQYIHMTPDLHAK